MEYDKGKSPIIKNLIPGLTERGKIKIGKKGDQRKSTGGKYFQLPQKLDHFIVTTLDRGDDNNFLADKDIHKEIGKTPKAVPVKLLYNDLSLNFQCRYSCYDGKTLDCSGDGEYAHRYNKENPTLVKCPCGRQDPTYTAKLKCKINGTLSVIIDCQSASVGGVWKFRTTGYNSTVGILSSLTLIKSITGGILAGIPLNMTIMPKVATNPVDKSAVTIYVVGVEYKGSVEQLRDYSLHLAQNDAVYNQRILNIETEARKMISVETALVDEAADIVEEFIPEELVPDLEKPESVEDINTESEIVPVPVEGQPGDTEATAKEDIDKGDAVVIDDNGKAEKTTEADTPDAEPEMILEPPPKTPPLPEKKKAIPKLF